VFWAAIVSQALVFILYFNLSISYLWYNLIGCAACVLLSVVFQALGGPFRPTALTVERQAIP
jgi:solute:Na+ symporter, SSS family